MRFASRVEYRERQRLRAGDLQAEQDYLLGLAGRHHLGPHTWGIVSGLHVSATDGANAVISPGLAIDGYGREVVVGQQVKLPLNEREVHFVYLQYCERTRGRCGANPNSPGRDVAEVFVTEEELPIPKSDPDLLIARAAGQLSDYPPWPILLGTLALVIEVLDSGTNRKFEPLEFDEDYRFVGLRAARVVSPSGRVVMRIGKETLADPYHFLISTRDKQNPQNRFAIDRAGNPIFWGNVLLLGSKVSPITLPVLDELVKIEAKTAVGGDLHWASHIESREGEIILVLSFRSGGETEELAIPLNAARDPATLRARLTKISPNLKFVRIALVDRNPGSAKVRRADNDVKAEPALEATKDQSRTTAENFESRVEYEGAELLFEQQKKAGSAVLCGCCDTENQHEPAAALVIIPGSNVPLPATRDIYAIRVADKEKDEEQLRISAGTFAEGDFRTSFSIGAPANGKFRAWWLLKGNGATELPYDLPRQNEDPTLPVLLDVKGTLELPPIKPDPRDRVYNYLVLASFMSGILTGVSTLELKIEAPPTIEPSQPWEYDLLLKNIGVGADLTDPTTMEFINGAFTNNSFDIKSPIHPTNEARVTVKRQPGDIPRGATELIIKVQVAMQFGLRKVAATATSTTIKIRQSPTIGLNLLPDPVPPGWRFPIEISNDSETKLKLGNKVSVENLTPNELRPKKLTLNSGDKTKTDLAQIALDAVDSVTPKVTIKYKWADGSTELGLTLQRTLTILKHVTPLAHATPVPDQVWKFDLELKNTSGKRVKLTSLDVAVHVSGSPAPASVHFNLNVTLRKDESFTQKDIAGVAAPAGTEVVVEVEVDYVVLQPMQVWKAVQNQLKITI